MPDEAVIEYFLRRERAALRLAENAADAGIRSIHLTMAKEYRKRANEKGKGRIVPTVPTDSRELLF